MPPINTVVNPFANGWQVLSSERIAIFVTKIDSNGGIAEAKIAYPGFFTASPLGHTFLIVPPATHSVSVSSTATIRVTSVRSVIDLNPAYYNGATQPANTSGTLEKQDGFLQ